VQQKPPTAGNASGASTKTADEGLAKTIKTYIEELLPLLQSLPQGHFHKKGPQPSNKQPSSTKTPSLEKTTHGQAKTNNQLQSKKETRLPEQNHNKVVPVATNYPPLHDLVPGTSKNKEMTTPPPPNTEPPDTNEPNTEREENNLHKDEEEELPNNEWQQTPEQRKHSR